MARPTQPKFLLTQEENSELRNWLKLRRIEHALVERARIVLYAADGLENLEIAARLGISTQTVLKWCKRFASDRLSGLQDKPRTGMPPRLLPAHADAVVARTLGTLPPNGLYWSTRAMAKEMSMSQSAISRIWRAARLQPRRQTPFQVSADPLFAARMRDFSGLYLDPPTKVLVVCMDRHAQLGADYHRAARGDTPAPGELLLARLDKAIAEATQPRHRGNRLAFLEYLQAIDAAIPGEYGVSLIMDNPAQDLGLRIQRWFIRHPRFRIHWAPSNAAWLNEARNCFHTLHEWQTSRNNPRSTRSLLQAIRQHLDSPNATASTFVWIKPVE